MNFHDSTADSCVSNEEFSRLIEQVLPALELYARQWSSEPADIVQDAFLKFWRQDPPPDDARAWLFRVVRNLSISQMRSTIRRKDRDESHALASDNWFLQDIEQQLDGKEVTRRLMELPIELREPVIAHLWGELTFQEIGDLTGAASSTVHRRYQEAMQRLRTELNPACPHSQTTTTEPTKQSATSNMPSSP